MCIRQTYAPASAITPARSGSARNAVMWDERLCKALARMAAPGATAATWSVARELRDGLSAAGYAVARAPGFGSKRDMCCARFPGEGEAARRLPSRPT